MKPLIVAALAAFVLLFFAADLSSNDPSNRVCPVTNAVLVNTARGELVDPCALVRALDEGRPGAAALDVLPGEQALRDFLGGALVGPAAHDQNASNILITAGEDRGALAHPIEHGVELVGGGVQIDYDAPGPGGIDRFVVAAGGVDRFDGDTLNRFIDIDAASMPHAAAFARNGDVSALTRTGVGVPHPAWKTQIYVTAHGAEDRHPDIQKLLHRDTFFSAMKFWYFLRPVRDEDGPVVDVLQHPDLLPVDRVDDLLDVHVFGSTLGRE